MRVPVELKRAYRLLNHGPTTLISAAHGGRRNVMAAAWVMPLDFDPPKVAAVLSFDTFTRELVEASGEFVVAVPCVAQAEMVAAVGSESGREVDKFAAHQLTTTPASQVAAPLIDGCLAWLECRLLRDDRLAHDHDLLLGEVLAAWADDDVFDGRYWHFADDARRSIHHIAGGRFFATGAVVTAAKR